MEQLVYLLTIFSLFGTSCSVSNRAFRELNRKVDLIRTSLNQKIGDLEFEVLDLRNQLESERDRADRLEELLNGTVALAENDAGTVENVDIGEGTYSTSKANVGIFAAMTTAFQHEKERARQFENTVTQTFTKVSETTAKLKSGFDHLRRTVEAVADDAQKSTREIEDIQNELAHIRTEVNVSIGELANLRGVVESVTDEAHKGSRDIEDVQTEIARIHGDEDVINATSKIADLQHDRHAEEKEPTEDAKQVPEKDCGILYAKGTTQSGVYTISPDGGLPFSVYCDMTDGGWTVMQRRIDGTVNFSRTWDDYVSGFGDVNGEYWLGLEKIHRLTRDGTEIYFDLGNYDGTREYAHYKSFTVHDATTFYRMNVDAYSYNGSIGERFSYHNNMKFSTYDRDNNIGFFNCAKYNGGGGWWYNACFRLGNLNGEFGKRNDVGICYLDGRYFYVKTVTIKLKHRP